MTSSHSLMSLDVGEKRIGVAIADSSVRIAIPYDTIEVDGNEINTIEKLILSNKINILVVGYPRNQSGEATNQTKFVEDFIAKIDTDGLKLIFQDESLTSVTAEKRLIESGRKYTKGDIDKEAASIILQDYLEQN